MGCFNSKTARCSKCYASVSAGDLLITDSDQICHRCIQNQQIREYNQRLAALRDDSTTGLGGRVQVRIEPTRTRHVPEAPRHSIVAGPRYTASKIKRNTSIHSPIRPLYGEYKCTECRHTWTSRRSWRNMYQQCQKCGKQVYPHLQRELRNSDMTKPDNPHPQHLCEKCIRLGYYCGEYNRRLRQK